MRVIVTTPQPVMLLQHFDIFYPEFELFFYIYFFLEFDFCRFCVVIRFFLSSPPQRPMTSNIKGFSIPDFIHYIYFPILILEKEPVFPFLMFSAKQRHYWYHFYNVFGMTRSLSGNWTRDLPHSKPALYHCAIEEAVFELLKRDIGRTCHPVYNLDVFWDNASYMNWTLAFRAATSCISWNMTRSNQTVSCE